jgi:hypothetical protein
MRGVFKTGDVFLGSSTAFKGVLICSPRKERASGNSDDSLKPGGDGTGDAGEGRSGKVKFAATALCKRARSTSARAGPRLAATGDGGDGGRGVWFVTGDTGM